MAESFFDSLTQLEFFAGDEKPVHSSSTIAVVSSTPPITTDHQTNISQGIFVEEESVDLSALLENFNSGSTSQLSPSPNNSLVPQTYLESISQPHRVVSEPLPPSSFSFRNYGLPPPPTTTSSATMYGTINNGCLSMNGHVDITATSHSGVTIEPMPPVSAQMTPMHMDSLTGTRPAPGKAPRSSKGSSKKRVPEKGTAEYRQKRDRNNEAVRKSREKSKIRVYETECRVKELEDENAQLQSKITLLTKELNVLKSLFTSAGVTQPPSLQFKEEFAPHK